MYRIFAKQLGIVAVCMIFIMISAQGSEGAEITVKPAVDIVQEYNDNIFLERSNKNSDYITRLIPSINLSYKAPFWEWQLGYALNWWYYHKLGRSYDSHQLSLNSRMNIIDNFLYLDITDLYSNVALDERRASNEENLNENRTDTNNFTVSPYIKYRITSITTLTVGYRYTNIWYREKDGINRQLHSGFTTIERAFSPTFSAAAGMEYTKDEPENPHPDNSRTSIFLRAAYALTQHTKMDATLGYRWIDFSRVSDNEGFYYNVGVLHHFYGSGELELRVSSDIAASSLYGVRETKTEQLTIRYGEMLKVIGSIFHGNSRYYESALKDETRGTSVAFEYRPKPRLIFSLSGGYEKNTYKPQEETREIYRASGEIAYQLTERARLSLRDTYTVENGRTDEEDYKNNIISVQLKTTI